MQARLVWAVDAWLGEGPVWCADEGALRFVDIKGGKLHRFDPATGERETCDGGGKPSFIVPAADGGFVVGAGHALRRFDGRTLGETIATIAMPAHNRTNDATVDASGRLWFGSMDDAETRPTGALHWLDGREVRTTGWTAVVTNGPAVNCAGTALYHVDSSERTIWRIPLEAGVAAPRGTVFVRLDESEGVPDGVVVDSDDCLWIALWDGWGLRRYAPTGELIGGRPALRARDEGRIRRRGPADRVRHHGPHGARRGGARPATRGGRPVRFRRPRAGPAASAGQAGPARAVNAALPGRRPAAPVRTD
jgi:sugar lactone lactonase YvrE